MTTTTVTPKPTPNHDTKFWIHPDDFNKVIGYAGASYSEFKAEIAGQMIVTQDEEGDFVLHSPEIMKQTVSGGECNLDAGELAQYYCRNAKEHGLDVRFCWWHSHHTMGAFWSGTDDHTILTNPSKDWTLSLVVNLKKEYKLRIQFFKPFLHEVNVELNFITVETEADGTLLAEVKEKCTQEHHVVTTAYNGTAKQGVFGFTGTDYYGYGYGSYAEGHYNHHTRLTFNKKGIPKDVFEEAETAVDGLLDELNMIDKPEEALSVFNQKIGDYNKEYVGYNFKISTFDDAGELQRAIMAYWPEDFFENIKKGALA